MLHKVERKKSEIHACEAVRLVDRLESLGFPPEEAKRRVRALLRRLYGRRIVLSVSRN